MVNPITGIIGLSCTEIATLRSPLVLYTTACNPFISEVQETLQWTAMELVMYS